MIFIISDEVKIINKNSEEYPKKLYDLKDPPKRLYVLGNQKLLNNFSIAIVGARKCDDDAKKFTEKIGYDLAKNNICIISGMALGIDSIAHNATLKAGGKTIAVLGSGFNDIYPKENLNLFYKILESDGLIISEYDLDAPPLRYHFLRRNRIVSALANGVFVVQARENSGSITTAKHAIKLKRNLFVLPGAASDLSYKGSNNLLVNGAKCVLSYENIMKEYESFFQNIEFDRKNDDKEKTKNIFKISEEYMDVYKVLSNKPKTINQIALESKIPIHLLSSKLTIMEIDGIVKSKPGNVFVKCY